SITDHSSPPPRDLRSFPTRRSSDLDHGMSADLSTTRRIVTLEPPPERRQDHACATTDEERQNQEQEGARHSVESNAPSLNSRIQDRKSTRLNSSHSQISYAVFCLKK